MKSHHKKVNFLVSLIHKDEGGRYSEETHHIWASHPEIAHRIATSLGKEERYHRSFLGLSCLKESAEFAPSLIYYDGDGFAKVLPKEEMKVFSELHWFDCSEKEMMEALQEPIFLIELENLNDFAWDSLEHAYGKAEDLPFYLRGLTSSCSELREEALWQLAGSIYHEGRLYPATSYAIPFLIKLAINPLILDREGICELLEVIAVSCIFEADEIRLSWDSREKLSGKELDSSAIEAIENEISVHNTVNEVFNDCSEEIKRFAEDDNPQIAVSGRAILKTLGISWMGDIEN